MSSLTNEALIGRIPMRAWGGGVVPYADFEDIIEKLRRFKFSQEELRIIEKGIEEMKSLRHYREPSVGRRPDRNARAASV